MLVLRANACAEASSGRVLFLCLFLHQSVQKVIGGMIFFLCNDVNLTGPDSSHSPAASGLRGPGNLPDNPELPGNLSGPPDSSVWQVPADSPSGQSALPGSLVLPALPDSLPARPVPDNSEQPVPLRPAPNELPVPPVPSGKPWKTGIPSLLPLPRQARPAVPAVSVQQAPAVSVFSLLHAPTDS